MTMPRVAATSTAGSDSLSTAAEIKNYMFQLAGVNSSFKLRNCFVKIKKCENTLEIKKKRGKLSKEEKAILLPHKKSGNAKKDLTHSVKKGRVSKSKKDKRFQLKITSFYSSTRSQKSSDRASPDSGIASRSESPDTDLEDETNDSSLDESSEKIDDTDIKTDFLKSLDDDDENSDDEGVESDSSSSDENDSDWDAADEFAPKRRCRPPAKARKAPKIRNSEKVVMEDLPEEKGVKSEYEQERDKKIKDKNELFAALKAQWSNFKAATAEAKPKPKQRSSYQRTEFTGEVRRSNRSIGEKPEYGELSDEWRPPAQKRSREDGFDEDNYRVVQRKNPGGQGRTILDPNTDFLMPEDVTDAMIDKIHWFGRKVYDSAVGTSCHQCRQKTTDQKTICRSGYCVGIRGQFCGTCLENRYGENVGVALKDPDWTCPPCRNICNCSFCLETPTGQLIYLARGKGFKSVHHYLAHLREKWDNETNEAEENSD